MAAVDDDEEERETGTEVRKKAGDKRMKKRALRF